MDVETKLSLIKSEPTEEILTEAELRSLLETNSSPSHYLGLEISGMLHLGHMLVGGKKINDFTKAGFKTQVLLADWHTMANNKFGGDWDRIIKASEFYKLAFTALCPGAKLVLGSNLYKNNNDYWKLVMQLARKTTMARATRTLIIEGRSQTDVLHVSQYFYPMMQAADIVALGADVAHAGLDQRKVHVLAKELFKDLKMKNVIAVHHHLLSSLLKPPKGLTGEKEEIAAAMKMSKSKQGSAIPITATDDEILKSIRSAWCPEKVIEENPVLELCKYMIFPRAGQMTIERKREFGGNIDYENYAALESDYREGKLHPMDLKAAVSSAIINMLEPFRRALKGKEELLSAFGQITH